MPYSKRTREPKTIVLVILVIVAASVAYLWVQTNRIALKQSQTLVNITGSVGMAISSPYLGQTDCTTCGVYYFLTSGETTYRLEFGTSMKPPPILGNAIMIDVIGKLTPNTANCAQTPSLCPSGGTIIVSSWNFVTSNHSFTVTTASTTSS
jgi:hypothetical protein